MFRECEYVCVSVNVSVCVCVCVSVCECEWTELKCFKSGLNDKLCEYSNKSSGY